MKNIVILGSTGSIGKNTIDVINNFSHKFKVLGLSAGKNLDLLIEQIKIVHPEYVAILDKENADILKNMFPDLKVFYAEEGIFELINIDGVDVFVNSIIGSPGLKYTYEIIKSGKQIALANKESIVMAGNILMPEAKKNNVEILPVDSEHSALFHLVADKEKEYIDKLILTASGGPFFDLSIEKLKTVSLQDALNHPVWKMGSKITIDSATLMNKGFEVIEAHYLFEMEYDRIDVIIHPESIIHSMIEMIDGEIYAQISKPDMRYPILNALSYPEKYNNPFPRLKLEDLKQLTFKAADNVKFPLLEYAYTIGKRGGNLPAALSAADDVVIDKFLKSRIKYIDIFPEIEKIVESIDFIKNPNIDDIFNTEKEIYKKFKE